MTSRSLDLQGFSCQLSQSISDAQKSVRQLDLNNVRLMLFGYCLAEDRVHVELRPRCLPALKPETVRSRYHKPEVKKFRQLSSDGCLSCYESGHKFGLTKLIKELNTSVLSSGAVLYPGCKSSGSCPTVIFCCQNELWKSSNKAQIAEVIDYLYHITRESLQSNGLALLIDVRNAKDRIEIVTAVISSLEASVQKALRTVYFVMDGEANSLALTSTNLPLQVVAKVIASDAVFEIFDRSQIPVEVGGSLTFNLKRWVDYHSVLEAFVLDCFTAANCLVGLAEELTQSVDLPRSVRETEIALAQHHETVRKTLESELVQKLCSAGKSSLEHISELEREFSYSRDMCDSAETANELFQQLQSSVVQLKFLAVERQQKLEGCLQLRHFEEQASQMINKLCTDGEDLLQKYGYSGDNLRSTKLQLQEFSKSYELFKDLVAKGKELIEDASVFTHLGICDELIGIKEIRHELKSCMASYLTRMEVLRQMLESTNNCYQLLDQSFEWALKTMKFVVDMKLEKEMSQKEVERSKVQLENFMKEHPPPPLEIFAEMESLISCLSNQRLSDQWLKAKGHCIEIDMLIKQRYETLIRVLNRAKSESNHYEEAKSVTFLADVEKNSLTTAANENTKELKSQNESRYSMSSNLPNADRSMFNSAVYPESIYENVDLVSQVDLDVCAPDSGSQHSLNKRCSFDDVIPHLSHFEANDVAEPIRQHSSVGDFSRLTGVVFRRSHSSTTSPANVAGDSRPTSQAFDVSEYILKDSLSNIDSQISSNIRPYFSQSALSGPSCEVVSHKPPSGLACSPPSSPQSNMGSGFSYLRHGSLPSAIPSSASKSVRNPKPSWKSFRKVLSSFTDRDINLRKNFFRRSSSDFSGIAIDANSTESLPGRLQDEERIEPSRFPPGDETMHRKYGWTHVPSNSHMIFSNRLALASHSQSTIDIHLNDDDIQRNRVLSLIVRELTMTESDYINSLNYVITNYIPESLSEDLTQPLRGKKNLIFGNIEKIYEFHSQVFLAKLQRCQNLPFQLGTCFLQHESEFYLYALYNKNKPKADDLLEEFGSKYFQKKQRELNDRMDLSSYLLKPVQRMGKYALLLRQIIKECPDSHPDYPDLKAALAMVKFQLRHGNDLLTMDCLRNCDVNLQEQGMLLRQHEFLVYHGRRKCLRQVFLFEELVVFSKTKHNSRGQDVYIYKNSIKTSELGLTESVGESGCRFELWFRKRTAGMTYILQSSSPDVKQQWVDDISQLLWKQTFRNKERRLTEMACMGIGSKPSLDLKQSKDNINDRFVNICPSERSRATRPKSVSLSSCHDGRRPHSLISVSSVSSTGSSFSSGYGSCLSSGHGAITGVLTTTEESPLEYNQLSCEEANPSHVATNNALACVSALSTGANSVDDSHVMNLSASTSNDSGFIERGCIMASIEEKSETTPESIGYSSGLLKEDAYTQTTLERPHKTLSIKPTAAPMASLESDCDDFY